MKLVKVRLKMLKLGFLFCENVGSGYWKEKKKKK